MHTWVKVIVKMAWDRLLTSFIRVAAVVLKIKNKTSSLVYWLLHVDIIIMTCSFSSSLPYPLHNNQCVWVGMCMHVHICVCVCVCACMHMCVCGCMCTCVLCVRNCVHAYMCVCVQVSIHVCVFWMIYIQIYIYINQLHLFVDCQLINLPKLCSTSKNNHRVFKAVLLLYHVCHWNVKKASHNSSPTDKIWL